MFGDYVTLTHGKIEVPSHHSDFSGLSIAITSGVLVGDWTMFDFVAPARDAGHYDAHIALDSAGKAVAYDPTFVPEGSNTCFTAFHCARMLTFFSLAGSEAQAWMCTVNDSTYTTDQIFVMKYITAPQAHNPSKSAGLMSGGDVINVKLANFPATDVAADLQVSLLPQESVF